MVVTKTVGKGRLQNLRSLSVLAALLPAAALLWHPAVAVGQRANQNRERRARPHTGLFAFASGAGAGARWPDPATAIAQQQGVVRCAPRIAQLESWAGRGSRQGWLMLQSQDADHNMLGLAQVSHDSAGLRYTAAAMAPGQDNGCGFGYQVIRYHAVSCARLARRRYAGLPVRRLDGGAGYAVAAASNVLVVLLPAGVGCMSIRGKTVY